MPCFNSQFCYKTSIIAKKKQIRKYFYKIAIFTNMNFRLIKYGTIASIIHWNRNGIKAVLMKKKKNLCERRHLELKRIKKYKGCCTHDTDIHLQSLRIELFIIFQASSAKSRIKNKWSWIKIEQDTITLFVRRIELIAVKKNINYKAHFYWFPRAVRKIYIYTFATPHKD